MGWMSLSPILSPIEKPMELCCVESWHPHLLGAKRIVPGWLGTGAKLGAKEAPGGAAEGGRVPSGWFFYHFCWQTPFYGKRRENSRGSPWSFLGKFILSEKKLNCGVLLVYRKIPMGKYRWKSPGIACHPDICLVVYVVVWSASKFQKEHLPQLFPRQKKGG